VQVALLGPGDVINEHCCVTDETRKLTQTLWAVEVEAAATGTVVYEIPIDKLQQAYAEHKANELGGKRTQDLLKKLAAERAELRTARTDLMNLGYASSQHPTEPIELAANKYNESMPSRSKFDPATGESVLPPPPYPTVPQRPLTVASKQRSSCVAFVPDSKRPSGGKFDPGYTAPPTVRHQPYMDRVLPKSKQLGLKVAQVDTWGAASQQHTGKTHTALPTATRQSAAPTKSALGRVFDATHGKGIDAVALRAQSASCKSTHKETPLKVTESVQPGAPYEWTLPTASSSIPVLGASWSLESSVTDREVGTSPAARTRQSTSLFERVGADLCTPPLGLERNATYLRADEELGLGSPLARVDEGSGASESPPHHAATPKPELNVPPIKAAVNEGRKLVPDLKLHQGMSSADALQQLDWSASSDYSIHDEAHIRLEDDIGAKLDHFCQKTATWRKLLGMGAVPGKSDKKKRVARTSLTTRRPLTARLPASKPRVPRNSTMVPRTAPNTATVARSAPSTARQRAAPSSAPSTARHRAAPKTGRSQTTSHRPQTAGLLLVGSGTNTAFGQSFTDWKNRREGGALKKAAPNRPVVPPQWPVNELFATPRTPRPCRYGKTHGAIFQPASQSSTVKDEFCVEQSVTRDRNEANQQALELMQSSNAAAYATTRVREPDFARPHTARPRPVQPATSNPGNRLRQMQFRAQDLTNEMTN
jgi:hypothetical protein